MYLFLNSVVGDNKTNNCVRNDFKFHMSKHGFELDMWGQEAKVRGLYLSIACECEFFMDIITSKCEEADGTKREALKLSMPYELGAKLKRCRTALSAYNLKYYNFLQGMFNDFEQLAKYRNMLAHGRASFDKAKIDRSFIIFDWIEGSKSNRVRNQLRIEVKPFVKDMESYRKQIFQLYKLHAKLCEERGDE